MCAHSLCILLSTSQHLYSDGHCLERELLQKLLLTESAHGTTNLSLRLAVIIPFLLTAQTSLWSGPRHYFFLHLNLIKMEAQ